ncbi:nucleotide sugar dehydrogenase [Clostridium sp. Cult2]|uniref:nucleotide sugar dehydrogenase n=1 Tax=Clostridium sp. Cult2 TaxID=2079003 RepID=UPI001F0186EB|nr:nucleotide sugar dehydrogenase [Clostridium sp. Cult2]MCF6465678.1 nucleotide sugar dehydrogenase [Clostridium sp. Cult2]
MISFEQIINREEKISIIGLGYVGISLAVSFAQYANVIGFDIDVNKINNYKNGIDLTKQVGDDILNNTTVLFTSDENRLREAKFHIIAVPTPIYPNKLPNLKHVIEASKMLGRNLLKDSIVIYESTVYPGVTEEICVPILEKESGLKCGPDFKIGYSPERINPGDYIHRLENIVKIVSGMDSETLDIIDKVYNLIIKVGTYRVENIKIAEAAKVIENTQRDINIALMNEISIILHKLDIDTKSVLKATSTKWNSLDFTPGLVGGHCIGVDSYFLTYIAEKFGYSPNLILTGRKINNFMSQYIAENTINKLIESGKRLKDTNVAILGFSFKENCSDIRNTKVVDIINELKKYDINIKVVDPIVNPDEVINEYGIKLWDEKEIYPVDAIIFAVPHEYFYKYTLNSIKFMYALDKKPVLIDIKGIFDKNEAEFLGYNYWRL